MKNKRETEIHVYPQNSGWAVMPAGTRKPSRIFSTNCEALDYARDIKKPGAEIVVFCGISDIDSLDDRYKKWIPDKDESQKAVTVRVTHHLDKWQVKTDGASRPTRVTNTQREAIQIGKRIAKNQNADIIVQGKYGGIKFGK